MNDEAAAPAFQSQARLTPKRFGVAPQGTLTLADGRLRFARGARVELDAPLERLEGFCKPRYMIGAGFRFDLQGRRYWITFNRLSYVGAGTGLGIAGDLAGMAFQAIDLGGQWALASAWNDVFARAGLLGDEAAAAVATSDGRYMSTAVLAAEPPPAGER